MRPKRRVPGQVVELTRRTTNRHYFLRPGRDTFDLVGYLYTKATNDKDQGVCATSFMSGHGHMVHVDRMGQRSEFMQQFASNVARKRNLQLGRRGHFWEAGGPGDMVALDLEEVVNRIIYTCLQPVAAGLVERVEDWTGFQVLPRHWGKTLRFKRPKLFGKGMPEWVELKPEPPPGFRHLPLEEVVELFEHLIRQEEERYARERAGRPVAGIAHCESVNPFDCPHTPSPMGTLNPRFAGTDRHRIIQAIKHQRVFERQYEASRRELLARRGSRRVVFPSGTLQLARRVGVTCEPHGPDDPHATDLSWTANLESLWSSVFGQSD